MNYPAAELRGIKMNFYLINPDAEHRGILLIKKEKIAVAHLDALLTASQCDGQLPLARLISAVLARSARLSWWKKDIARLDFAAEEFGRHPLGTGETDPKYLDCICADQVIDGKYCLSCGGKIVQKK